MKSWHNNLEQTALAAPERLSRQLARMAFFYKDLGYFPYRVAAAPGSNLTSKALEVLPWTNHGPPRRPSNIFRADGSVLEVQFDMGHPTRIDSLSSVLLMIFVIGLMVGFSMVLSNTVSEIVLRPLENLLRQVHQTASLIFKSVSALSAAAKAETHHPDDESEELSDFDATQAFRGETDLLEKVVRRLQIMSEASARPENDVENDKKKGLDADDRAMIRMLHGNFQGEPTDDDGWEAMETTASHQLYEMVSKQRAIVESTGLSMDLVNSWNLNPLELDKARNHAAVMFFLGPHNHGIPFNPVEMGHFLEKAEQGHKKTTPYHNWYHAVDVTHAAYRFIKINGGDHYLSRCDRFSLLLSAVCHDLGHPGVTNAFLIETSHEIALCYNDVSPLENMHCAKLFELLNNPGCHIFSQLSKAYFQEVRRICIDAILYTDFSKHFAMIKELQVAIELHVEIYEEARAAYKEDKDGFPEEGDCLLALREQDSRRMTVNLLLHMSDISSTLKPFRICRIWANQLIEEYFLQGDQEKKLGVPVQPLNDRTKVNRAFSQIGFIEFLVCPLIFVVLKMLPPMQQHTEQLILNAKTWHQQWLKESASEAEAPQLNARMAKLQNRYLDHCE